MRLKDRVAIVVGAGQSPGEGIGNGRATALTFAREGAKGAVRRSQSGLRPGDGRHDRRQGRHRGGVQGRRHQKCRPQGDGGGCEGRWGRIDILHNNVGVSLSGGDAELLDISEEAFDRCVAINLKSCVLAAKHVIPIMRAQKSGAIINISSMAAITTYPMWPTRRPSRR
jgi:NAD(P)-dependent dehydrogenase (short-subunit alcohol dehydrogenase family)